MEKKKEGCFVLLFLMNYELSDWRFWYKSKNKSQNRVKNPTVKPVFTPTA